MDRDAIWPQAAAKPGTLERARGGGSTLKAMASILSARLAALAALVLAGGSPSVAQDDIVSPIVDVEQLAEVIGGAHQLRQLCDRSDQQWREQMLAMIELEAQGDDRRQRRMIDAFNAGFRRQEQLRLACGAESRRVESELAAEGRRLAEQLQDRYLN
jgi:uncharacterized protein (TIGR02301 family)